MKDLGCRCQSDTDLDDGLWELHALQEERLVLIAQGLSRDHVLQATQSNDVACPGNLQQHTY